MDSSVPDHVIRDAFRLRQIILNLVGNAIKFTERGQVNLIIKAEAGQRTSSGALDHFIVEFIVIDTGIGIAEQKLGLIFDTFQQADGSMNRKFGGTGLSLSISKRLVSLMGGELWVKSEAGKGSEFHFTCKVLIASDDSQAGKKQILPYSGHRVLLVDEGHLMRSADLEVKFEELGFRPVVVAAEDALPSKQMGPSAFDAVLVKSMEAARRVRNEYGFGDIPIVLLAPTGPVSLRNCLDLGVSPL